MFSRAPGSEAAAAAAASWQAGNKQSKQACNTQHSPLSLFAFLSSLFSLLSLSLYPRSIHPSMCHSFVRSVSFGLVPHMFPKTSNNRCIYIFYCAAIALCEMKLGDFGLGIVRQKNFVQAPEFFFFTLPMRVQHMRNVAVAPRLSVDMLSDMLTPARALSFQSVISLREYN